MEFTKVTETPSKYRHLEKMTVLELLTNMNNEDKTVPLAVEKALPQIDKFVTAAVDKMLIGGRLFYMGAGTSGRLGVLDASECPPTFGVPHELVIGIMSGGDKAIRKAVEKSEDDRQQGWLDLKAYDINSNDVMVGIAASGTTPYVIGALDTCRENGIITACITCNPGAPIIKSVDYPIEVEVGPEFLTGSTRMKSGTAQKLVLNMISTSIMIKLGRVEDNKMVNMQLTNDKLIGRGTKMLMEARPDLSYDQAKEYLIKYGGVKKAVDGLKEEK